MNLLIVTKSKSQSLRDECMRYGSNHNTFDQFASVFTMDDLRALKRGFCSEAGLRKAPPGIATNGLRKPTRHIGRNWKLKIILCDIWLCDIKEVATLRCTSKLKTWLLKLEINYGISIDSHSKTQDLHNRQVLHQRTSYGRNDGAARAEPSSNNSS